MTPRRAGVIPKTAWSEAIRMSHATAISSPPPKAKPFSMAITGEGNASTARIMSSNGLLGRSTWASPLPPAGIWVMSYPAQNASLPSPRRMRQRVSRDASASSAERSSFRIFRFSAFFFAGLERVTVATPPSRSTITLPPISPPFPVVPGPAPIIMKSGYRSPCSIERTPAVQGGSAMNREYPKDVKLKDGSTVTLKPFERKDKEALFTFFQRLPEGDRIFLKDNVADPAVIERWATELNYDRIFPLLAWKGNDIVADATLHKNLGGWMKHGGTIRIGVAKDFHRKGMGSVLANELFLHALKSGLEKVVAEMMESQPGAKRVFEKLGFKLEATFRGHVRDQIGVRHDLLVLTKDLEEFWANIQTHEYFSYPTREMEG